jgi:hypothetical protein
LNAELPDDAVGLRLAKIVNEDLRLCEAIRFTGGRSAVVMTLNRARISGRVEIGGEIKDHFADVLNLNDDLVETIALDAGSYRALKTRWMRCKMEPAE